MWQDTIISIGQWLFVVALLPSIFGKNKPSLWTSLITATILSSFTYCFFTLHLVHSAISSGVVSFCWFILFFQGIRRKNDERREDTRYRKWC